MRIWLEVLICTPVGTQSVREVGSVTTTPWLNLSLLFPAPLSGVSQNSFRSLEAAPVAGPSLVKVFPSPFVNSWTMLPATPHPPAAGRVDLRGHSSSSRTSPHVLWWFQHQMERGRCAHSEPHAPRTVPLAFAPSLLSPWVPVPSSRREASA